MNTSLLLIACALVPGAATATPSELNAAARQHLAMLERVAGFADRHWNETAESYDAAGKGVTWARGNGGVCLVNAVLLVELPEAHTFSARQIPRAGLLDHTRRTIRRLCLTSAVCTDARVVKPGNWGGADPKGCGWHWQAGLETEHWVLAAKLLDAQLDGDTKALVRQVASAEADGALRREIARQVRQEIGHAALPSGEVIVFSRWTALRDLEVAELVDHPFRWVEIAGFIAPPEAKQTAPGGWTIDGKLHIQVLGSPASEAVADGISGEGERDDARHGVRLSAARRAPLGCRGTHRGTDGEGRRHDGRANGGRLAPHRRGRWAGAGWRARRAVACSPGTGKRPHDLQAKLLRQDPNPLNSLSGLPILVPQVGYLCMARVIG